MAFEPARMFKYFECIPTSHNDSMAVLPAEEAYKFDEAERSTPSPTLNSFLRRTT